MNSIAGPAQVRIERDCHFLHCGHLHDPEHRPAGDAPHACLTLTAGASFETRHTHNSYSIVSLDLLHAVRGVTTSSDTIPHDVAFTAATTPYLSNRDPVPPTTAASKNSPPLLPRIPRRLRGRTTSRRYCSTRRLRFLFPRMPASPWAPVALLESGPDSEYKTRTAAFTAFRNALRVLYPPEYPFHGSSNSTARSSRRMAQPSERSRKQRP